MQVLTKIISYHRPDEFHLYPLGDFHCGTKHCVETILKSKIKQIKEDPLAFWVGMGDYGEFIMPTDPRWDAAVISDWVDRDNIAEDQTEYICQLLEPIKDKCLGLLEGNHEDAIRIHLHIDVQKNICKRLGILNLGYSCFIRFIFRRGQSTESHGGNHIIMAVLTHGAGAAVTRGAKIARLERFMDGFHARIYAHAHVHDIITDSKSYLDLDARDRIIAREKVGAMTGCWFTAYTQGVRASYAEKKNYPPTTVGCPVFTIIPDHDEVKVLE